MRRLAVTFVIWGMALGMLSAQKEPEMHYEQFNALFFQGVLHYIKHETDKARNDFLAAIRLNDSIGASYFYLALVEKEEGNPEAAQQYLDKACALDSTHAGIYRQHFSQEIAFSISLTDTVPERNQSIAPARDVDDFLARAKDFSDAEIWRQGKSFVEKYPFRPHLVYTTALAGKKLKKYKEAIRMLENGMDFAMMDSKLYPDYVRLLVELYELTGQKAKAGTYRKLLKQQN